MLLAVSERGREREREVDVVCAWTKGELRRRTRQARTGKAAIAAEWAYGINSTRSWWRRSRWEGILMGQGGIHMYTVSTRESGKAAEE